jgi:hypothetical protein
MSNPEADGLSREFKRFYSATLIRENHSQSAEAININVEDSTVSNYLSLKSPDRNLPVCIAVRSLIAKQIASWFAEECGGLFVPLAGKLDGNSANELRAVCQAMGDLFTTADKKGRLRLMHTMQANLANAIQEEESK